MIPRLPYEGVAVTRLGPKMQTLCSSFQLQSVAGLVISVKPFLHQQQCRNNDPWVPPGGVGVPYSLCEWDGVELILHSVCLSVTNTWLPMGMVFPSLPGSQFSPAQICLFPSDFLLPIYGMREPRQSCRLTHAGKSQ